MIARHGDRIAAAIFLARTHVTSDFQRQSCVTDPNFWVDPLELAGCRNRPGGNVAPDADAHGLLSPQQNRAPGHGNNRTDRRVQSHHPSRMPGQDGTYRVMIRTRRPPSFCRHRLACHMPRFRRRSGHIAGSMVLEPISAPSSTKRCGRCGRLEFPKPGSVINRAYSYFDSLGAF